MAIHFTGCKPHTVGIPTCRQTLLTPHLATVATLSMWGWRTIQVRTRFWSTAWEYKHQELSIPTPTRRNWWRTPRRNSNLAWNTMVSVVWSNLHRDSSAQPINLTGKADGKHLDFSSQKRDYGENLNANRISQCFQWTEDLESIQGKECKLSSFHTFQPG